MNLGFVLNKAPVPPQKIVFNEFLEKEELKCDPFYLAVICGAVYLLYLRLQQHEENSDFLIEPFRKCEPSRGIKISFNSDCSVIIEKPGFLTQTLPRVWNRSDRTELRWLRPHFIKLLKWFDYKQPVYRQVLDICKKGIEVLLEGYKNPGKEYITITQNSSNDSLSSEHQIKILSHTSEADLIIRMLEADIDLLKEAIEEKNERQEKEFQLKLKAEEQKYFPLHQLYLIEVSQTVDMYMKEKIMARWNAETVDGINKFFEAKQSHAFDHYDSITALISKTPSEHIKLRDEIRAIIKTELANCTIQLPSHMIS